jgi:hypothetical protein
MLTQLEVNYCHTMMNNTRRIGDELKKANELKALELKLKYPDAQSDIDKIMSKQD